MYMQTSTSKMTASSMWSLVRVCIMFAFAHSQTCQEGWVYHGGSCYAFGESPVTWADAQEICHNFKGKLAEIETDDENTFLKSIVRQKQVTRTWLGGTDVFHEGTWQWTSTGGIIYPYTDWAPAQPDETSSNEDCLYLDSTLSYQWADGTCSTAALFVCESSSEGTVVG